MIVSKKQKYKSLKNSNLNNKSVLILDSFISCMNKKSHNINIPTNINTLGYRDVYKRQAIYISEFDDIVKYLKENVQPNDVVITTGAGPIYLVGEQLIK